MKLKTRLWIQSTVIIAVTLSVTAFFAYMYIYISREFSKTAGFKPVVIIAQDGKVSSPSEKMSDAQLKSILIDINSGAEKVSFGSANYNVSRDKTDVNTSLYVLTPTQNNTGVLVSSSMIFIITLSFALFIASRKNEKNIILPIRELQKSAKRLTDGSINIPVESMGEGELTELFDSMEALRLRLREAVYYREKYDDNRKFLISGISHDLRTPVTAIRGYIEGILDGVACDEEKKRKYLETALLKTETVNDMIDDLLLYSKLDLGKIPFDLCTVNMKQYLCDCISENDEEFKRQGKTLSLSANCENPLVTIDPARFKRVIQNILSNALKNTPQNDGDVKILLRESAKSVIIEINDNGRGISSADIPHVFDRFFRSDSARKGGGSGLGLTIAKQITEGLGGRIWVAGKEGDGARFIISLKKQSEAQHEKNTDN